MGVHYRLANHLLLTLLVIFYWVHLVYCRAEGFAIVANCNFFVDCQ